MALTPLIKLLRLGRVRKHWNMENPLNHQGGDFAWGNQLWKRRTPFQRSMFKNPVELYAAVLAYFEWVEANPLKKSVHAFYEGIPTFAEVPLMRAMSLRGLCAHLGTSIKTWIGWRKERPDLEDVMEWAEAIIYEQKFTGAAAGLLNANLVSRDLGLADKSELSGPNGGPIETEDLTARDADAFTRSIAGIAAAARAGGGTSEAEPKG